jgi:alkylation response protein AidB-like acyl-CoA dehydrogenase
MTASTKPGTTPQSFAEATLRLSGKTDDEARRTGAVDAADDQVEAMFAPQYQTASSPVHRAVWEGRVPLDLFASPDLPDSAECDASMNRSLEIVRRRRQAETIYDEHGKVSSSMLAELGKAGYWGMLIDRRHGGQGAPFARFIRFLVRMATLDPVTAGLASVHGCIGAVDPVRTFGNAEQKAVFLPRLASGEALSGFALTEPGAGSDLTALRTTARQAGDVFEVTGEKLFITNAIPGRTIGLVVILQGKPAVLVADLPPHEDEHFQIVHYGLHALRNSHNNGLRFNRFRVPRVNLLVPPIGDGLTIAYHGLNLGRLALCANAAGTMRILLANLLPWADFRRTYGQQISSRELVKRRIARLAALIAGADALGAWGSWLIDQGYRGELECVVAKIFASEALKEASIELLMKTHGGRSFLHGHLLGDNVYDLLAPCIYEGEGEMLGLAFFKSLVKQHGLTYFGPIGEALERERIRAFNPVNPRHAWALRRELSAYTRWSIGQRFTFRTSQGPIPIKGRFAPHMEFATRLFRRYGMEISGVMRKHQLKLADRQCRMAELSQRVQDTVVLLVSALWGHRREGEVAADAADILCQDLSRKLSGMRPSDAYFRECARLADRIIAGEYEALAEAPLGDILMPYENR